MDAQALIIWLIVGGVAGWLAGMVVKGGGYGLIGDIIVGIIGGLIAGWLLPQLGIAIGGGILACGVVGLGRPVIKLPQSWSRQAPTIRFQAPQPRRWPGQHSLDSLGRRSY